MADFDTPSRLGQGNAAGDTDALFLKVFPGEVLAAFRRKTVFLDKSVVKTIGSGKSAQFLMTGRVETDYHTVGTDVSADVWRTNERVIYVDPEMTSAVFVSHWDEKVAHFESRNEIANQLGEAIAVKIDKTIVQTGILAARSATNVTGLPGGSVVKNTSAHSDGLVLASLVFDAAQELDEKDVPLEGRMLALRPAQYRLLGQVEKVLDTDIGGKGSYAEGRIVSIAGIPIIMTNHLPSTNVAQDPKVNPNNTYHGDFSDTVGLVWTKEAMGTVRLASVAVEKEYFVQKRGTLLLASSITGHGVLAPHCAVEISKSA